MIRLEREELLADRLRLNPVPLGIQLNRVFQQRIDRPLRAFLLWNLVVRRSSHGSRSRIRAGLAM
jgi:hypothetical protein